MQKSETKLSQDITNYMEEHNCHTIGEAFANLEDNGIRIRNSRYKAVRKQYEEEIKYIFYFQNDLDINSDLYNRLVSKKKNIGTIFYKKPLRSQKWLVGKCTLEKNKTRCPISHPEFERFRAYSFLNNIKYRPDSQSEWRNLSMEIREGLFDSLFCRRVKTDFIFKELRERIETQLQLKLDGDCEKENRTINYKDKQSVPGCPVTARLRILLGDSWETYLMEGNKQRTSHSKNNIKYHTVKYSALDLWHICYETDDPEYLTEFANQQLGWNDEQTKKFIRLWSAIRQGYAMLSLKAITNINRMLLYGLKYSDAVLLAKIPDIVKLSDDEIRELIQVYGTKIKANVETEKLITDVVVKLLAKRKSTVEFTPVHHFFGYEGRCAFPSNFDATYCYALGRTAMILAALKKTGQMAIVSNLKELAEHWHAGGFPLTSMMNMEKRGGEMKPVIQKALVELEGKPFKFYAANRDSWAKGDDMFAFPGAIQYYGSREICDQPTKTLLLEQS